MFDVLFALSLFLCVLGGFEISLSPRFPFPALPASGTAGASLKCCRLS